MIHRLRQKGNKCLESTSKIDEQTAGEKKVYLMNHIKREEAYET